MNTVAIFGGSFNPVHWGHRLIAETALNRVALDRIIWVPTYCPPHKPQTLLAFPHRLEMVQRAIADQPLFLASDLEAQRGGRSFAIATWQALHRQYPNTDWYWIIGKDAFQTLPHWQGCEELVQQCTWLIAPRNGDVKATIDCVSQQLAQRSLHLRWHLLPLTPIPVSSSLIRQRCQLGQSIADLVPEAVRSYIVAHNLYK
ncbi:nicotinate (nicotinamide) nucleotide adenylyltransferase [Pantanalinema rosaneae CENA516]|uniref:nicotinate (nicotinamide) nucleotide adenylyltransferase n=1 Tax=Pantanalinema rosaneae TaxID=1620701 RepID=UPI003D6E39FB